ncbi:MAG: polyamine aminopropyltransferase [Candidatus Geothermarchaeota archaeon]
MIIGNPVLVEELSPIMYTVKRIRSVLVNTKTKYQNVLIAELYGFGKSLILDGYVQSTEADEYLYHEPLVHPSMVTHPSPERVLIIGGSEGATLREVLKHKTVVSVDMVDIDGELIEYTKKYLQNMHQNSFEDARVRIHIEDGLAYIRTCEESKYDVVIMDLTDPYSPIPIAKHLYEEGAFMEVKRILRRGGIVVTQAGCSFYHPNVYLNIVRSAANVFKIIREYYSWVPSFGYINNFLIASDVYDPAALTKEEVDIRLRNRGVVTKYYDGRLHTSLFNQKIVLGTFEV